MWTRQDVDNMLAAYRSEYPRYRHLTVEAEMLKISLERLRRQLIEDEAAPQAQVITDMPKGSGRVGSKVEDVAIKLADGYMSSEMMEMQRKLDSVMSQLQESGRIVEYVSAWLDGLTERERWLVVHQYINREIWADILDDYNRVFDKGLSKDTLKRMRDRGLYRIYQAVGAVR